MTLETWLSFTFISLILGLIPGPSVCFTIAYGLKYGGIHTIPSIVGQLTANALQILIISVGLSSILENSVGLFIGLKLFGAAYLVLLGTKQWRAGIPQLDENIDSHLVSKGALKSLVDGFLVCATNPKAVLYYAAFLPQFIVAQTNENVQLLTLGATSILVCGFVLLLYTLLAGKVRYWLIDKNYWYVQNRFTGALMIVAGMFLAFARKN